MTLKIEQLTCYLYSLVNTVEPYCNVTLMRVMEQTLLKVDYFGQLDTQVASFN